MYVYLLQHSHIINDKDDTYDTKIIGIYSSEQKAKEVIETYKKIIGFEKYPNDFYIDKYKINKSNWKEGFISFDEMNNNSIN